MSLLSIDQQYEFAAKIQNLIMFVGLLTDDEVETLQTMRKQLQKEIGNLGAVAGVLAPLAESDHKISHNEIMIKRLDAILAIHQSNLDMRDADNKLESQKAGEQKIKDMFGLLS